MTVYDYPVAEAVLVTALAGHFTSARVCTETPENLSDVLPCIRITRFGGVEDEVYTFDNPWLDFDCYDTDYDSASRLAYDVRFFIRADLPGTLVEVTEGASVTARAFIARTQTIGNGPRWSPYDNTSLRRFTYTAAVRLHALEVS